jgi:hypothetical protein
MLVQDVNKKSPSTVIANLKIMLFSYLFLWVWQLSVVTNDKLPLWKTNLIDGLLAYSLLGLRN